MSSSSDNPAQPLYGREVLIAAWGVLGVVCLFVQALIRLTPLALEPISSGSLGLATWLIYAAWAALMAYTEGYRTFQLKWAPRVVARAVYLAKNPTPLFVALAPLFCMSLIYSTRRRLLTSWLVTIMIVVLVVLVRKLEQPWRGIIDGGVVVGLGWGVVVLLINAARALGGQELGASPELP